jgi:serine/threonine protein kinase
VRGIKITEYCDQNTLPTKDRLNMFIKVCQAIQHAHQKGIIHRDTKPSNILVTLHDGVPLPKVIDSGYIFESNPHLALANVAARTIEMAKLPGSLLMSAPPGSGIRCG